MFASNGYVGYPAWDYSPVRPGPGGDEMIGYNTVGAGFRAAPS